jgi:hypothetical protein
VCWHVCELPLKCHFRAHLPPQLALQSGCRAAKLLERSHCLRSLSLHTGASADDDLRWLWGPRTKIMCSNSLGNCDYMLLLTTGTGSFVPTTLYIVCKSVVLQWDVHTT